MAQPKFFETPADFRKWLEKHHESEPELLVGMYKKGSGIPSMTWPESVDQALCFGWIDGVRKSIDEKSYSVRFTPRRPGSIWSAVNIKKVDDLTKAGLMHPKGIEAFEKRTSNKSAIYSYENDARELAPEFEKLFKANKIAWEFFISQPPGYKKLSIFHVMNAKQEKTKINRLLKLIAASEAGRRW